MNEAMPTLSASSEPDKQSRFALVGRFIAAIWSALRFAAGWLAVEFMYWLRMFYFVTRRFLRVEAILAFMAMIVFFGSMLISDSLRTPTQWLQSNYQFFTVVMIVFCSNLLPRERDENTLEILWSQPISRNVFIMFQLFVLLVWCALLMGALMLIIGSFTLLNESFLNIFLAAISTTFAVGTITVLISTFTRQTLATLLVATLLFGLHYTWLRPLGPIDLYTNTAIIEPERNQPGFLVNRIALLVLVAFAIDYLFRRLRRTAEWFT